MKTETGSVVAHPIEWTDEKVSRLWNYYSHTPPYSEMYFAKVLGDRMDTTVGPFRVEVLEGLKRLRFVLEPSEHAVACDLVCVSGGWKHMPRVPAPEVSR